MLNHLSFIFLFVDVEIIVRMVKSRRMRWAGHVVRVGEDRGVHRCWWGSLRERGHWEDQEVDGRIILRWIFRKL